MFIQICIYHFCRDSVIVRLQDDSGCDLDPSYPVSLAVGNSMEVVGYSNVCQLNNPSVQNINRYFII